MATATVPTASTNFIGRNRELTEIIGLLAGEARLLTLVGPGGIGKTRLALEVARIIMGDVGKRQAVSTFSNGIYFVPLQPLTSPDFIVSAIAEAVDFQCYGGCELEQQLLDHFRDKSLLLVLDNLEHLLVVSTSCPKSSALRPASAFSPPRASGSICSKNGCWMLAA